MAEQQLPAGFTAATELPDKYKSLFGDVPNLTGYKVNTFTDKKTGKKYSTLSFSEKGAYGEAASGYGTFGAKFTEGPDGVTAVDFSSDGDGNGVTGNKNTGAGIYTSSDGKTFTDPNAYVAYQANIDNRRAERQSAYDLLFQQFQQYGLGNLVTPLKGLIESGVSPAEFTLRLRETDAYKKRFAANQSRINNGLRALSEAEYIGLEDQYQDVMRRYGLPKSYYERGDMGIQAGFEKFIGGDVSPVELEDRIQTAQNRVINAAPEVTKALKQFYPDITGGEILAYALDPNKAIEEIKRKVSAAEIGAGAMQAGLGTGVSRAEELAKFGVTGQAARQGYQAIASFLPQASKLSDIYKQGPYNQATAESEVFGITGAADAERKRKQLAELETATFSGKSGAIGGALARERSGQF